MSKKNQSDGSQPPTRFLASGKSLAKSAHEIYQLELGPNDEIKSSTCLKGPKVGQTVDFSEIKLPKD